MASFMWLTLDVLVGQTLLMLQISYPLVFVQMVHQKFNIFSMIFQQMNSMFFSNNFHCWTQHLVEIKTLMRVLLLWNKINQIFFNPMFNCNNLFWILEKGQKKWRWRLARGYIMLWVSQVHFGNAYFLLHLIISCHALHWITHVS